MESKNGNFKTVDMSCSEIIPPYFECNADLGSIVSVMIWTVRGYVEFKSSFYRMEFKLHLKKLGYSKKEIEESITW